MGKTFQRLQLFLLKDPTVETIQKLRKKWGIPPEGHPKTILISQWLDQNAGRTKKFDEEIESLIEKWNFPSHYYDNFRQYIVAGILSPISDSCVVTEKIDIEKGKTKHINIVIYPEATIDEVRASYKFAAILKKNLQGYGKKNNSRNRLYKKLDRDTEVYKLHRQGLSAPQIKESMKTKSGENLQPDYINIIIKKMKKRIANS